MEEKTKHIQLSTDQWHYKLIKFVFGKMTPDPTTMVNLCPYFWILIASLFLVVFITPFKLLGWLLKWIFEEIIASIERQEESRSRRWVSGLSKVEALELYSQATEGYEEYLRSRFLRIPKRIAEKTSKWGLLDKWARSQGYNASDPDYKEKLEEAFKLVREERKTLLAELDGIRSEKWKKDAEKRRCKEDRERKIEERMDSITNIFNPSIKKVKKALTFKANDYTSIIKITKQFVGLLLTGILAVATFFLVQLTLWFIFWLINIWYWPNIVYFLGCFGAAIVIIAALVGLAYLIQYLSEKAKEYREDNDIIIWYVRPFIYLDIGTYSFGKFVFYYPGRFIFYSFLWKCIVVGLIYGILKSFWNAIIKAIGIFGEYFGSSYTDYCPGIKWEKPDKNK